MFLDFGRRFFIYLLPLALTPIIIHLLFRKKTNIYFSDINIISSLVIGKKFIKRWQRYLLLLLRTMIILMAILLFADPILFFAPGTASDKSSISLVFLFDVSCSMNYLIAGEPKLERNKRIAKEIIEYLPGNVNVSVASYSNVIEKAYSHFTNNKRALYESIDSVKPTLKPTDHSIGLRGAAEILEKQLGDTKTILWFTDAAAHGFLGEEIDLDGINLLTLLSKPNQRMNLYISRVAHARGTNISVELISAALEGDAQLELFEDGKNVFYTMTKISNGLNTLTLPVSAEEGKSYYVKITGDSLPQDNKHYFLPQKRNGGRILLIDGNPQPGFRSEIYYLVAALETLEFKHNIINLTEVGATDFSAYDAIIFSNFLPSPGDTALNNKIESLLRRNGKVIIFLGDNVTAAPDWLKFPVGSKLSRPIAPRPTKNMEIISSELSSDMVNWDISAWEYRQIDAPEDYVLIKDETGVPFFISDGQLHLFNTMANKKWSDFAGKPIFLVLIDKLLANRGGLRDMRGYVGESVSLNIPTNSNLRIKINEQHAKIRGNVIQPQELPGIYEIDGVVDGKRANFHLVINTQPNESELSVETNLKRRIKNARIMNLDSDEPKKILTYLIGREVSNIFFMAISFFFLLENFLIFFMLKDSAPSHK